MSKYIDIHTHSISLDDDVYTWYISTRPKASSAFFYGIHPWDVDKKEFDRELFLQALVHPNFIGIGEVGLDKLKPNYEKQLELFTQQVKLAVENQVRIITIHNVKSQDKIIEVLRANKYKGKILLHGFNGSLESFLQMDKLFKVYISVGTQYIKNPKLQSVLKHIPLKQTFFETDTAENGEIKKIYAAYSQKNKIPLDELKDKVFQNFTELL